MEETIFNRLDGISLERYFYARITVAVLTGVTNRRVDQ